jgi:hypothetical protein
MVQTSIFWRIMLITLVLQLVLALGGHLFGFLSGQILLCGRMMIAVTGGYLYGMEYGRGYAAGSLGGALAGGLAVLPAVLLSVLLGDGGRAMAALGSGAALICGGIGGSFGQWAANLVGKNY